MRDLVRLGLVVTTLLVPASPATAGVTSLGCLGTITGFVYAEARNDKDDSWVTDRRELNPTLGPPGCTLSTTDAIGVGVVSTNGEVRATASLNAAASVTPVTDPTTGALSSIGASASFGASASADSYDEGKRIARGVAAGAAAATAGFGVEGTGVPYDLTVGSLAFTGTAYGAIRLTGTPVGGSPTELFARGTEANGTVLNSGSTTGTLPPGTWSLVLTTGHRNAFGENSGQVSADLRVAPPQIVRWRDPVDGTFADKMRWDPERVPAAPDPIQFDLVGPYTVDLGGARSVARMSLHTSNLTLAGGTLGIAGGGPSLAVGLGGKLTLPGSSLSATDAAIGDTFAPRSIVRVAGGGSFSTTGRLQIGGAGPGTLEVQDGTVSAGETLVGGSQGPPEVVASEMRGTSQADPRTAGGDLHVHAGPSGPGVVDLARAVFGGGGFGSGTVDAGGLVRTGGDTVVGVAPGPGLLIVTGNPGSSDPRSVWESGGTLIVGDDAAGQLSLLGRGRVTAPDARIGASAAGEGSVDVLGESGPLRSELVVADTVIVGDAGNGRLLVRSYGAMSARHLQLGLAVGGQGTVEVFDGAQVSCTESITVGVAGSGELYVASNGTVAAKNLALPGGNAVAGARAVVTVAGQDAAIQTQEDVEVGAPGAPGELQVTDGGEIRPAQTFWLVNGEASVAGFGPWGAVADPSQLSAGDVIVGAVDGGNANLLVADRAQLSAKSLTVADGSVNPAAPPASRSVLTVRDATVSAQVVQIGTNDAPPFTPRPGTLVLERGGVVNVTGELRCHPRCTIAGNGRIDLGSTVIDPHGGTLTNLGEISAGHSPGRIEIAGSLVQEASGRLVVEAAGLAPERFDVVEVAGDVALGGTLVVRFQDGFLPRTGDTLPFLRVVGAVTGRFAAVEVHGVAPGFEFTIAPENGAVVLTAKNDAAPVTCTAPGDADGDGRPDCLDNCVAAPNADQANRDADPPGDACDPCTGGVPVASPALTVARGRLVFKGKLTFPSTPGLDLARTGVRLLLVGGDGRTVLDATAPAGTFDKGRREGWRGLTFRSRSGPVTVVAVRLAKKRPRDVGFTLSARAVDVTPGAIVPPLSATVLLDAPTAASGLCGEVRFTGPASANPACTVRRERLRCGRTRR